MGKEEKALIDVTAQISKTLLILIKGVVRNSSLEIGKNISEAIDSVNHVSGKIEEKKDIVFDLTTPETIKRTKLGKKSYRGHRRQKEKVLKLENWFISHIDNPYLDKMNLELLSRETSLSRIQIKNWISNRRRKEKSSIISVALQDLLN